MIDLTPLDVRKKRGDFRSRIRGYDPEEVDSFLELVAERLEALVKENMTLSEQGDRQFTQLSALEEREKAIQEALVTAQRLRDDLKDQTRQEAEVLRRQAEKEAEILRSQATREADLLKKEAEAEIDKRLGSLDSLIRERKEALAEVERKRARFLKAFRNLLERELDVVEVEEARTPLDEIPLDLELGGEDQPEPEDEPWEGEEESEAEPKVPEAEEEPKAELKPPEAEEEPKAEMKVPEAEEEPKAELKPPEAEGEPKAEMKVPEAEVASLTDDVSEALGATVLGGIPDTEPTPVEDLAPDAFSTQKFEPAPGDDPADDTAKLPVGEETEKAPQWEPFEFDPDQLMPRDPMAAGHVGENLTAPDDAGSPTEPPDQAAEDRPEWATLEVEASPEPEPSDSPSLEEPKKSDTGPSHPLWLSAILKEEEDERADSDDEDRQA